MKQFYKKRFIGLLANKIHDFATNWVTDKKDLIEALEEILAALKADELTS